MKQTLVGALASHVNLGWLFNWLLPWPIRQMWSPIPELWLLCGMILQGFILSVFIIVGGEAQSFYYQKEYPVDLSIVYAIDFVFDLDLSDPYIQKYYPHKTYQSRFVLEKPNVDGSGSNAARNGR